jgi:regulator of protease activity HflC (stomatin/prohibitin superfamily)
MRPRVAVVGEGTANTKVTIADGEKKAKIARAMGEAEAKLIVARAEILEELYKNPNTKFVALPSNQMIYQLPQDLD